MIKITQEATSTYNRFESLARNHPVAFRYMVDETKRQRNHAIVIASELHQSLDVLTALATPFAAKYGEGYSGKRYYDGNDVAVDPMESRTIDAAKVAFGGQHANVQPLSRGECKSWGL